MLPRIQLLNFIFHYFCPLCPIITILLANCASGAAPNFVRRSRLFKASSMENMQADGLPHCKRSTVISGVVTRGSLEAAVAAEIKVTTTVQLKMSLGDTSCFHVDIDAARDNVTLARDAHVYNGSLMYTLEYRRLEDQHPIRQRYQFGIPEIKSNCVCDCFGGDDHCDVGFAYQNCSLGQTCYTSYHAHREGVGCPAGGQSEVCCRVSISPYKDWRFWALTIGQPNRVAVFVYRLYERRRRLGWRLLKETDLKITINRGQLFELESDTIQLHVSGGNPGFTLSPGTYFARANERTMRGGVPINQLHETSLGKLGWYRRDELTGRWLVQRGWIKFQDAHNVVVRDCKSQKYEDSYDAEFYVSSSSRLRSYFVGYSVSVLEPWIKKSTVEEDGGHQNRFYVSVEHSKSPYLTVSMSLDNRPTIRFYHHKSHFRDFSGAIQLDKHSNRYLNLTFVEAKGTLVGKVFRGAERAKTDVAFSVHVGQRLLSANYSTTVTMPSSISGSRWVCFHPSMRPEAERCKWLRYYAKPLDWFQVRHEWSKNQGECLGCNEIGVQNFVQYLNPHQWLDGLNSYTEKAAFVFEVVVYLIVLLIILALIKKCVWPLTKCLFCDTKKRKK